MLRWALVAEPEQRTLKLVPRDRDTTEWVEEFSDLLDQPAADLLAWVKGKGTSDSTLIEAALKFERDVRDLLIPMQERARDVTELVEVRACRRVGWGSLVEIGKPS